MSAWDTEAPRVGTYKPGHSYFLFREGGRRMKEPFNHARVSGSFESSFTPHAGRASGSEYACAYLVTPNQFGGYRVTSAYASARYIVKK